MYNLKINSAFLKMTLCAVVAFRIHALKYLVYPAIVALLVFSCKKNADPATEDKNEHEEVLDSSNYPGVPISDIYEVTLIRGNEKEKLAVFQNACPEYEAGKMDMLDKDQ